MKVNIGITEKNLSAINSLLNNVLADAVVLYTKTRKFHWNVSGNSFMELHELFEHQYKQLEQSIDEIAERINKLFTTRYILLMLANLHHSTTGLRFVLNCVQGS